jgi:ketosteroid isomerase-like protein
MNADNDPLLAEREFFHALTGADTTILDRVLADDFILVDVMSGSEISKSILLDAIATGQLKFETIETLERRLRQYGDMAVIVGATRMRGRFADEPFIAHSRYTHVFARQDGRWRMVSAQGTQIAPH